MNTAGVDTIDPQPKPPEVEAPKIERPPLHPNFMREFFDGPKAAVAADEAPAAIESDIEAPDEELFVGGLAAGVVKIPLTTSFGNFAANDITIPAMEVTSLTDGSASNSWASSGTGAQTVNGDLTIGEGARFGQRRRGGQLATGLNDDNQALAVIGREWREIQLINNTTIPGGFLQMIGDRDTHRIFIYKDNNSQAFSCRLASTGLKAGMKFMFVNLSAAETAGTNEVQTIAVDATAGTFTVTFGGATTAALAFNISAANLQTALEGLSSIGVGNITVSGGPTYTLTFRNALGSTNVAQVTTDASLLTGNTHTATPNTTTPGVAAIGQLTVDDAGATILGGTYRFTLSRGAVLVLEVLAPGMATTFSAQYAAVHKYGTVAAT